MKVKKGKAMEERLKRLYKRIKPVLIICVFVCMPGLRSSADTVNLNTTQEEVQGSPSQQGASNSKCAALMAGLNKKLEELKSNPACLLMSKTDSYKASGLILDSKFDEADQFLNKWEYDHPEDKEQIRWYRDVNAKLRAQPDQAKRILLYWDALTEYLKKQTNEVQNMVKDMEASAAKLPTSWPLINAVSESKVEEVRQILAAGQNPDKDITLLSPLVLASQKGFTEVMVLLLEHGANVNNQESIGKTTALMAAVKAKQISAVELLIEKGADVNITNIADETALNIALRDNNPDIIAILKKAGGIATKIPDGPRPQRPPYSSKDVNHNLIEAISNKDLEKVKTFLSNGAELNGNSSVLGTPLNYASQKGDLEIVRYLLSQKADIHKESSAHVTPIVSACLEGHTEIVKVLLENGAGPNQKYIFKEPILSIVSAKGYLEIAKLLLEKGAEIDGFDGLQRTALMKAAEKNQKDMVKFLLAQGAKLTIRDLGENTALSIAKAKGHQDIVNLLVEAGAKE